MRVLELFAGAGGGIIGAQLLGHRVVCAVENNAYCQQVLMARQEDQSTLPFPIWDDVRTFDGKPWHGGVDVVSAGFPCQPFSEAGKMEGESDERNMWPDTRRIIGEVRPRIVFLENVAGLVRLYLPRVLGDLAVLGYDAVWCVLAAGHVGARHARKRLWVMAHATGEGHEGHGAESGGARQPGNVAESGGSAGAQDMADTLFRGQQRPRPLGSSGSATAGGRRLAAQSKHGCEQYEWPPEPPVGRVVDGMAYRVERIRALGNGQVPQQYVAAWRYLEKKTRDGWLQTAPGSEVG